MNKICTSIEQSKKLIELGIDRKSSDMYYWCGSDLRIGGYKAQDEELDVPAWSLSALLELIPTTINEYAYDFSQLELTKQSVSYVYAIGNLREGFLKDNLLDAAFEMVCWLKENEKI